MAINALFFDMDGYGDPISKCLNTFVKNMIITFQKNICSVRLEQVITVIRFTIRIIHD